MVGGGSGWRSLVLNFCRHQSAASRHISYFQRAPSRPSTLPPPSRLAFIFICDSSSWISSDATNPTSSTSDHPTKLSALQFSWADQSRDGRASIPSTRDLGFVFSGVDLGRLFDPFPSQTLSSTVSSPSYPQSTGSPHPASRVALNL